MPVIRVVRRLGTSLTESIWMTFWSSNCETFPTSSFPQHSSFNNLVLPQISSAHFSRLYLTTTEKARGGTTHSICKKYITAFLRRPFKLPSNIKNSTVSPRSSQQSYSKRQHNPRSILIRARRHSNPAKIEHIRKVCEIAQLGVERDRIRLDFSNQRMACGCWDK